MIFGSALDRAPDLDQSRRLLARVREAGDSGARVVVLPESAAGLWTPTLSGFWMSGLRGTDKMVIAGAAIVDRQLAGGRAGQLYGQRMVPVSIRQAWLGWKGQGGGAKATFFGTRIVESGGERIAPLICYEQLLVWPVLQSIPYAPDVIVAIGNDWTVGTSIVAIQRARAQARARLFALPLVLSFNT